MLSMTVMTMCGGCTEFRVHAAALPRIYMLYYVRVFTYISANLYYLCCSLTLPIVVYICMSPLQLFTLKSQTRHNKKSQ
jgi:hypothetical protein